MSATITCGSCKQDLQETEFAWKSKALGRRHSTCKSCKRVYTQKHYANSADDYRERNAERRRRVKTEREGFLRDIRERGTCVRCDVSGAFTRLLHTRKAGFLGVPLHEVVRESRSKALFDEALKNSELKCEICAFTPYAVNLGPFQFGNPERDRNIASAQAIG